MCSAMILGFSLELNVNRGLLIREYESDKAEVKCGFIARKSRGCPLGSAAAATASA